VLPIIIIASSTPFASVGAAARAAPRGMVSLPLLFSRAPPMAAARPRSPAPDASAPAAASARAHNAPAAATPPEPPPATLAEPDVHFEFHDVLPPQQHIHELQHQEQRPQNQQQQQQQQRQAPPPPPPTAPHHPPTAHYHNAQLGHSRFGRGGAHLCCAELPASGVEIFVVTPDDNGGGGGASGRGGRLRGAAGGGGSSAAARFKGALRTVAATALLAVAAVLGRAAPVPVPGAAAGAAATVAPPAAPLH